ncbi:MAG TPA: hypothetical protein VLF61_02260, partial [Rhabdochlamydiaceae bacterium]|nr:hypothetical protein [Rhabdochlamydiaceae bacterium]
MKILDAILNEYHYPDKSPYVNIAEGVLIFTRVTLGRKMYQYYPENQRFRQIHERHDPLLFKIFCCVYAILAAPLALIAAAVKLANTKNRQIHQLFLDTNRAPPPPRMPVPVTPVVAASEGPQTCVICLEPIGNDLFINGSNECNHQLHMQCFRNAEQAAQRNLNFVDPANPNAWDPDYSGCPTCRAGRRPRPVRPVMPLTNNARFILLPLSE